MDSITIGSLCLAVWRISNILIFENGPWYIFREIRSEIGIKHDEDDFPYEIPNTSWGELFSCIVCISVWVAGGFSFLFLLSPGVALIFSLPFSISAVALLIDKWYTTK